MSKKQSNPKPKNIKRPAPPPAPPRPYSNQAVEDMIEGLNDMTEDIKKKNEGRMINPKDYLRTVTEGTVKPDRSFIWTEDSMEKPKRPEGTLIKEWDEHKIAKPKEPPVRFVQEGVEPNKKVYCRDCKYFHKHYYDEACYYDECSKVIGYEDNPTHRTAIYSDLEVCNKNNNCQYYKEKWYKKLWRLFK